METKAVITRYHTSATAKVYYDAIYDALYVRYLSRVKSFDDFLEINRSALDAFAKLNTQKFVIQFCKGSMMSVEAQHWIYEVLLPGMADSLQGKPLHHAHFMDPADVFSKVASANIKNKTEKTLQPNFAVQQFYSQHELEKYLNTVK